jgi:hypothetical protein
MTALSDDEYGSRVAYLRRQRYRARLATWIGVPLLFAAFIMLAPRIGSWIVVPLIPFVVLLQYVQFRAYTQMCPRCSQPLTVTRWGVYRTVPPSCPTCGLRITES